MPQNWSFSETLFTNNENGRDPIPVVVPITMSLEPFLPKFAFAAKSQTSFLVRNHASEVQMPQNWIFSETLFTKNENGRGLIPVVVPITMSLKPFLPKFGSAD